MNTGDQISVTITKGNLGRLVEPYPVEHCANEDCPNDGNFKDGAYMFRDLESSKFVVFCGDCTAHVELNVSQRFKLIAL